jgi:hypothetical protein
VALGVALDGGVQLGAERRVVLGGLEDVVVFEHAQRVLDQLAVGALRAGGDVRQQQGALAQLAREVMLAGLELALQLVAPGREDVRPAGDRELPATDPVDDERAAPAHAVVVRVERVQLGLGPLARARAPVQRDGAQLLVAVAEDVGGDFDEVADRALRRVAAGVDDRLRVLDVDPGRRRLRHRGAKYPIAPGSNVGFPFAAARYAGTDAGLRRSPSSAANASWSSRRGTSARMISSASSERRAGRYGRSEVSAS